MQGNSSESAAQGVRFAQNNEEIPNDEALEPIKTVTGLKGEREDLNPEAQKELQQLKTTLQNNIQSSRMQHHAFEPVSLPGSQPVSRVSGCVTRRPPAITNRV